MELTKKDMAIKYLAYAGILLLCSIIQNSAGIRFDIGTARCFLIIPVAVILSMNEDEKIAGLIGLFAGFLWDCVSLDHMGFNCIFLMFMCYFSACLVTYAFRDTFLINFIGSVVTIALYCVLYWLLFLMLKKIDGAGNTFWYVYLPSGIYTSVVAVIMYFVLKPIKKKLNKEQNLI